MRGAWGKPYGLVARVDINQILFSVRAKDQFADGAAEALRRCKYKYFKIFVLVYLFFYDNITILFLAMKGSLAVNTSCARNAGFIS